MPPSSLDPFMFVVNVEVFLRRGDRCLLIRRGEGMSNAAGMLAGVGGKAEVSEVNRDAILDETARHPRCPAWTAQSLRKVFEAHPGG
jgi:hypothetical protein